MWQVLIPLSVNVNFLNFQNEFLNYKAFVEDTLFEEMCVRVWECSIHSFMAVFFFIHGGQAEIRGYCSQKDEIQSTF